MNEVNKDQVKQQQAEKKPYTRPEMVKHGPVETLTQVVIGPSHPVQPG